MNKKEILEIRKQFTPEKTTISRVCGCYVDGEKNKRLKLNEAFLTLPEEEVFKYCEIFKKSLSGTLGKNLMNMEFPTDQEMPGGTHHFLMKLKTSKLQDETLLDEFYDKVIEHYIYGENYLILLIHAVYDIPGKSSDNGEMFDASDDVYEYMLCAICPVNLSKAGLCYNAEKNSIEDRVRDWIVDMPAKGFLFPAFNDRNTDLHSCLYYSKQPEILQEDLIDQVLGCRLPLSAGSQKDTFNAIIAETLGDDCDYEIVKNIHENLNGLLEESKESPDPLELTQRDVKILLENSGAPDEKIQTFEEEYRELAGDNSAFMASNVASSRKFNIQTPDVVINVNPDRTDLIETRIIDGRQCLVITVDDHIEVNGINVRTVKLNEELENESE